MHWKAHSYSLVEGGDLWWPSLISYHVASDLSSQPLPQIIKMAAMTPDIKIET